MTRSRRVDLLLLLVAAVWGSSYLAAKSTAAAAGVLPVLALRYVVAFAALAVVCAVRAPARPGRRELATGAVLGLSQAAVLGLETYGVTRTSATNAGLVISLTIVFTPVLESAVLRRWLPPVFFLAAVVAVVGICLLVTDGGFRRPTVGDGLMLAAATVRAGHVTALGRLTAGRSYSTLTLTLVQTAVGALVFTGLDPRGVAAGAGSLGVGGWLGIAFLGLLCSVFAFLVQLWAVRRTSAARASLLMGTEPLWAALVGLTLGGESLGLLGAVGGLLVVAGTAWGQQVETRARAPLTTAPPLGASPGIAYGGSFAGPTRGRDRHVAGRYGSEVQQLFVEAAEPPVTVDEVDLEDPVADPPRPVGAPHRGV